MTADEDSIAFLYCSCYTAWPHKQSDDNTLVEPIQVVIRATGYVTAMRTQCNNNTVQTVWQTNAGL